MKHKIFKALLSVFVLLISISLKATDNKTLLICVDGCTADIINYAHLPTIDKMIKNATFSLNVKLKGESKSTNGWASIFTGTYYDKHGAVNEDNWTGSDFVNYPTLFKRLSGASPAKKSFAAVQGALLQQLVTDATVVDLKSSDTEVSSSMVSALGTKADTDLFFAHYTSVNEAGKAGGFSNANIGYYNAITNIDAEIAKLLEAIKNRAGYSNENWMIVFTSNHGGKADGTFGGESKKEIIVPVIISGDKIDNRDFASGILDAKEDKNNSIQLWGNSATAAPPTVVSIPKKDKLIAMGDFTVEMWVKPESQSSDPALIADKDWNSGSNPGWCFARYGSRWKFNVASADRSRMDVTTSATIEDGEWHHLAAVFDPGGDIVLYTDGVETGRAKSKYTADTDFRSPYKILTVGACVAGKWKNYRGIFDEVRIWDSKLSAATIQKYMNKTNIDELNHPDKASLLLYYKMDGIEAMGNKVIDSGPFANHGTLIRGKRVFVTPLNITDIYPTVLAHLGINPDDAWNINGQQVKNDVQFFLGADADALNN